MSPSPRRPIAAPHRFRDHPGPACAPHGRAGPSAIARDGWLAAEP